MLWVSGGGELIDLVAEQPPGEVWKLRPLIHGQVNPTKLVVRVAWRQIAIGDSICKNPPGIGQERKPARAPVDQKRSFPQGAVILIGQFGDGFEVGMQQPKRRVWIFFGFGGEIQVIVEAGEPRFRKAAPQACATYFAEFLKSLIKLYKSLYGRSVISSVFHWIPLPVSFKEEGQPGR